MHPGLEFASQFQKATAIACRVILVFLFSMCSFISYSQDQAEIDSLERLLPTTIADTTRLQVLNELSAQTVDMDPARSIRYAEEALKLAEAIQHKKFTAISLHNIGNGHYNLAEFKLALFYYLKALHIQEAIGNKKGILTASGSIGNVFLDMRQPDQALQYFKQTIVYAKELNNKRGLASALISIGTVYSDKKDYKKALEYAFEAMQIFQEIDYKEAVATCQNNIADSYHHLKDYPKAMYYVTKAYDTYKEVGNVYGMALALNNIGDFYSSTGYPEKALEYYQRGLEQAMLIGAGDRIVAAYKGISASYKKLGRYKEALDINEKFQAMNDSIYNTESSKQIAEMQTRFETEKKAKEIDLLTKDKKIKEDELIRQRLISWTMAIGGILVLLLALLAIRANIQKRKTNRELEEKNQKIETAYNIIEDQHKDIKDSIRYAERLQSAILPTAQFNKTFGQNAFVFYKPKDIVSGDFYWIESAGDSGKEEVLFAAVDCTGHGVPGAFMSIVGHNILKQAVKEHHKIKPSDILDELNLGLSETLRQTVEESSVKDGMDIALCSLRKNEASYTLQYAGANNPLWIIRGTNGPTLEQIKGDKFPIGIFVGEKLHKFNNHTVELFPGDSLYIFTDGYADQFGGEKGKKFKYKPLQELLLTIQDKSMAEQKEQLDRTLSAWKGNLEQVDDILIIGIKIS
jgi:serine phosphatase RsbU (regulator of sigma subunit)